MANEKSPADPPKRVSPQLSSKARQAARAAEIANKQSELKREAAERRALREAKSAGNPPAGG